MSRKKSMPDDVKEACIAIVKGYERRRTTYVAERGAMIHNEAGLQAEEVARKLRVLEDLPETRRMRAVENSLESIGADLTEDQRSRLSRAIYSSCVAGREYPFERLGIDGMEGSCFYARRRKFLEEIAMRMEMM